METTRRMRRGGIAATTTALLTTLLLGQAGAEIYTIDENVAGSAYDGALDGFPFPPPGFAPDGTADSLQGTLAVALLTGVTEERGLVELPLASLGDTTSAEVVSATLYFNIDDVIPTFGPGTTFDGTAASSLVLWAYTGDGVIALADFGNVGGAPLAVVSTASFGTITDATLAVSGPLTFEVDITAALKTRLTNGDDFIGFVIATQDSGSATSLDNLGNGGAGPAGVNGAFLPRIEVVTQADAPPSLSKDARKCQKAIGAANSKLQGSLRKALQACMDSVLTAVADGEPLTAVTASCDKALDRSDPLSAVSKALAKHSSVVTKACAKSTPAEIGKPCDSGATTFAHIVECLADGEATSAEEAMRAGYASACSLLDAVGLGTAYPAVCAAD
jgi:hypothetical protein